MSLKEINPQASRDIILATGIPAGGLDMRLAILCRYPDTLAMERGFEDFCIRSDTQQIFIPIFRPLYQQFPALQKHARWQLNRPTVTNQLVDQYFTEFGDTPYLELASYDILPIDAHDTFVDDAREVMFRSLKEIFCGEN